MYKNEKNEGKNVTYLQRASRKSLLTQNSGKIWWAVCSSNCQLLKTSVDDKKMKKYREKKSLIKLIFMNPFQIYLISRSTKYFNEYSFQLILFSNQLVWILIRIDFSVCRGENDKNRRRGQFLTLYINH